MTDVGIIGAGATGMALAAELVAIGVRPALVGRRNQSVTSLAIDLEGDELTLTTSHDCHASQIVFVCTKAYDLAEACQAHLPAKNALIAVTLCNGYVLPTIDTLRKQFPQVTWRAGLSTTGVTQTAPGRFRRCGRGAFTWGSLALQSKQSTHEATLAEQSNFLNWSDDITPPLQKKWLFNVVINTLTASLQLARNGDLLAHNDMVDEAFREAYTLAVSLWGPWRTTQTDLHGELYELIRATSENENSMARDQRLGRRTETAYLAGLAHEQESFPLLTRLNQRIDRASSAD